MLLTKITKPELFNSTKLALTFLAACGVDVTKESTLTLTRVTIDTMEQMLDRLVSEEIIE
jgi:hypothetical protein